MLLALSLKSSGFFRRFSHSVFAAPAGGSMNFLRAARHLSVRAGAPSAGLSGMASPGFRTSRLSALNARYSLLGRSRPPGNSPLS
jgi:hypothetical protein